MRYLIVTGQSGAGKTTCVRFLEDPHDSNDTLSMVTISYFGIYLRSDFVALIRCDTIHNPLGLIIAGKELRTAVNSPSLKSSINAMPNLAHPLHHEEPTFPAHGSLLLQSHQIFHPLVLQACNNVVGHKELIIDN